MKPISETYNMDCMEYMRQFPDKHFELAIVDPQYGINAEKVGVGSSQKAKQKSGQIKGGKWDSQPPPPDYFLELFRVSKNQIICGANYFQLPPTRGIICWDKGPSLRGRDFSEFELLWTSFDRVARVFYYDLNAGYSPYNHVAQERGRGKIHPTQKPIALYKWLLANYAKPEDKILDTHLGSGSSRIAAHDMGFDFYATELDADYFNAQEARFKAHIAKPTLFKPNEMYQPIQAKIEL